jgi:hypothetical protein
VADRPVLIPTSLGPVGAVVSEPAGEPRAAAVLLQGAGRPARSGVNSFWTAMARALAGRGIAALRFDYAAEGESAQIGEGEYAAAKAEVGDCSRAGDLDLHLLDHVVAWFRARLGGVDPFLAGSCQGARMAIEFAAREGAPPTPSLLIAPFLKRPFGAAGAAGGRSRRSFGFRRAMGPSDPIDPFVVSCLSAVVRRAPTWMLVGDEDEPEVSLLVDRLGPVAPDLELEIAPGAALHMLDQPDIQAVAMRRLLARIDRPPDFLAPADGSRAAASRLL